MAQPTTKVPSEGAHHHTSKPSVSNGVITDNTAPKGVVNRKKQKRRQKQAAKQQAAAAAAGTEDQQVSSLDYGIDDEQDYEDGNLVSNRHYNDSIDRRVPISGPDFGGQLMGSGPNDYAGPPDDQLIYSDEENAYPYDPAYPTSNGLTQDSQPSKRKKSKKKKANPLPQTTPRLHQRDAYHHQTLPPPPPPPISHDALSTVRHNLNKDGGIWNTSSQEERLRIKEFWLELPEEERKSLVRIEKEAVLRKMKEQQKHSCSCTVCGRKRTAIEEELEVLYDAYYEELEQFANHNQQSGGAVAPSMHYPPPPPVDRRTYANSRMYPNSHRPSASRVRELHEDEDLDEQYSEEEIDDDEAYEDEDEDDEYGSEDDLYDGSGVSTDELAPPAASDFFTFGNSLTVKGGILTVADDLLKNDGQKFIDMMEQLAERRMQREEDAQNGAYRMSHPSVGPPPPHTGHPYSPTEQDDPYDDEEAYSDEEDEELDVEEDEMASMTESQRMEEGRRMFQIFAARMFEQRVLTAYREKVALERQRRLIEELDAELDQQTQKDEKKQRDAEKRKAKKLQQKQEQARKKALKEEQKAAEEAAAKAAEEKRQEELRQKREEAKRKKEEQKKAQEEEKQRKEAEKQRRLNQEKERQKEAERKAKEEKKRKEDQKRKEREERDAKEKAAKDKKAQEDRGRREREERKREDQAAATTRAVPDVRDSATSPSESSNPASETMKRPAAPAVVALPPGLRQQWSNTTVSSSSPQPKVATPILPGIGTMPQRGRDISASTSLVSTPQTPDLGSTKPISPKTVSQARSQTSSTQVSRASSQQFQHAQQPQAASPIPQMHHMGGFPPHPYPGQIHGSMMGPAQPGFGSNFMPGAPLRGLMQGGPHALQIPPHARPDQFSPMSGHSTPATNAPGLPSLGRPFVPEPPPGFAAPHPTTAQVPPAMLATAHSRTLSSSHEGVDASLAGSTTATNPIARPTPIQRPASVKPQDSPGREQPRGGELDDSKHLGSSALLDDSDEPLPGNAGDMRRPPMAAPGFGAAFGGQSFDHPSHGLGPGVSSGRQVSNPYWGVPSPAFPAPGLGQPGWGGAPGWAAPGFGRITQQRVSASRPALVRQLACQASRQLSAQRQSVSMHDLGDILRLADNSRPQHEPSIQAKEIHDILDTEGDVHNGGGYFQTMRDHQGRILVKWHSSGPILSRGPAAGVGEIGSPVFAANGRSGL